ncbi:MAG: patatin-like phospholipase family protein [Prevotellaceae bacterium]|nr:patatin-like phospholipase family protein [Prevotellaceae bacterium]
MDKRKHVSLVLSSGGARGYAHIGAIEELEAQGYDIKSVSGASMGALVGGLYAAGKLSEVSKWMQSLSIRQIFSLVDFSISMNHIVKGEKVMDALKEIVPDVNIEDLPIPFRAVAADIKNHREVVFDKGSLYEAIRASISIPSFFRPVKSGEMVLIDGGVVNPLPLNRVVRSEGDILVAVNVSAISEHEIDELKNLAEKTLHKGDNSILRRIIPSPPPVESNYFSLLSKTFSMMIQQNTALSLELTPPDVLVNIPMNRLGGFSYDQAEKIIRYGRVRMREALNDYRFLARELSFPKEKT